MQDGTFNRPIENMICNFLCLFIFLDKVVELIGGGLPSLVSFHNKKGGATILVCTTIGIYSYDNFFDCTFFVVVVLASLRQWSGDVR